MAVTALPSKFTLKWNSMCAFLCLGMAVWFYYDGHYNEEFITKETVDGKPSIDLQINRVYGPVGCLLTAGYLGYMVFALSKKKVTVDENGITLADGKNIPLDSMTKIDKSKFRKKGKVFIEYEDGEKVAVLELKDTVYDGIKEVINEILRLTGQEPEKAEEDPANQEKPV